MATVLSTKLRFIVRGFVLLEAKPIMTSDKRSEKPSNIGVNPVSHRINSLRSSELFINMVLLFVKYRVANNLVLLEMGTITHVTKDDKC